MQNFSSDLELTLVKKCSELLNKGLKPKAAPVVTAVFIFYFAIKTLSTLFGDCPI